MLKQTLILILVSAALGLTANLLLPNRIAYVGNYREIDPDRRGPIVPPEVQPGDPPFIAIDLAELEFSNNAAIFVDAREPEEFECGTIPGSLNIPFDYLPTENLATYFDSVFAGLSKDTLIITYCSGEECDLSLHLGRNLQDLGYTNIAIFFGGSREWEKFGLQLERSAECGE